MSEKFDTILTNAGLAAVANATITQKQVNFAKLGVGDSNGAYYTPTQEATALRNQVWIGNASSVTTDPNNPNWIVVKAVIPGTVGGFEIRELGIFDENNVLLAIGKLPQTYKPIFSEGSTKELTIKAIFEVTNTSAVTLKIDPSVIYASEKYVDDKVSIVASGLENAQQQLKNHEADYVKHPAYAQTTFASNIYSVNLTPPLTTYQDGVGLVLKLNATPSTGTIGINVNGLGNKSVYRAKGTSANASMFVKDGIYEFRYSATANSGNGAFILQGEGGSGNAQPSDVRTGKTFTNDDGEKTGTLVAYGVGELITAQKLVGREYLQVDQHRPYAEGRFLNAEIATINGVEYAFTYSSVNATAEMSCTETLTGRILWSRYINYEWQGRIVIKDSSLYVGYWDQNGVVTTGCGLEVMNALTGTRIKVTRHMGSDSVYVEAIRDLCYNAVLQEIIVIAGSHTNYLSIGRYDLNGNIVSMSGNLNSIFSPEGENPFLIQSKSTYIYVASTRAVYQLGTTGFGLAAKTTPMSTYAINGLALNTIDGVTHTLRTGALYVLGTFLTSQANITVTSSILCGLVMKGDLLSYASPTGVYNYRMNADGRSLMSLGYIQSVTNVGENRYNSSLCIGMSANAIVPPVYLGREYPPVYTKTLKVQS